MVFEITILTFRAMFGEVQEQYSNDKRCHAGVRNDFNPVGHYPLASKIAQFNIFFLAFLTFNVSKHHALTLY